MGQQELETRVPIVDTGKDKSRDGDRRLEREASGQLKDMTILDLAAVVGLLRADTIVRMPTAKKQKTQFLMSKPARSVGMRRGLLDKGDAQEGDETLRVERAPDIVHSLRRGVGVSEDTRAHRRKHLPGRLTPCRAPACPSRRRAYGPCLSAPQSPGSRLTAPRPRRVAKVQVPKAAGLSRA